MNLLAFIDQLGAEQSTLPAARRTVVARLGQLAWRSAAAAVPLTVLPGTPAAASTLATALDAMLLLLQLARTQVALHTQGLAVAGLVPAAQVADLQTILTQHQGHADLLAGALTDGGATVPAAPSFDFSGRRGVAANPELFPGIFTDYALFLQLAQQLADAGGRTYQGVMLLLVPQRLLHTAALQILATTARHAAHLRRLRRLQTPTVPLKPWPSATDAALVPAPPAALVAATSVGEGLVRQLLPDSTAVPYDTLLVAANGTGVQTSALAEAFDEPIFSAQAQAALNLFVA